MNSSGVSGRIETLASLQSRMVSPLLREAGISHPTFALLSCVASHGGTARQSILVEELGVAPATLSESIKEHVERGLLSQEPDPDDRRAKRIGLTASGRQVLSRIGPHLVRMDGLYDDLLGAKDSERLIRLLDKAITGILKKAESR
jgi:DNA-binding MarR family transcriptional regulator